MGAQRHTPKRGHGTPLEPLAQLGDGFGCVGTLDTASIILVEAAELVAIQAVKRGGEECQRALTQKRTLLRGGALERGHGAALEVLAQNVEARDGVGAAGAAFIIEAADRSQSTVLLGVRTERHRHARVRVRVGVGP